MSFGGLTFEPTRDGERLWQQYQRVFDCMHDGQWRTLADIAAATAAPTHSVSARLRDMRKAKFGAHEVERGYLSRGLFRYRLIVNTWADLI